MSSEQSEPSELPELVEQPERTDSMCPECGNPPVERVYNNLSSMGYLHNDQKQMCENGHTWKNGIPIGDFDRPDLAEDLWCGSCDDSWVLIHRIRLGVTSFPDADIVLDTKCPNDDCNTFDQVPRNVDETHSVALVGYPQITGKTEGCEPYGYEE